MTCWFRTGPRDETRYEIIDERKGTVLQTVTGAGSARKAQAAWNKTHIWKSGPRTTVRQASENKSLDEALRRSIPENQRAIYREALLAVIKRRVSISDLMLAADLKDL